MPGGAGPSSAPAAGRARNYILELTESHLTRTLFRQILEIIERLPRRRPNCWTIL